uniref:Ig-like domain-containing protein n=1 Tax=Oryzias melastigma TaxID=30732 RepID=A0A3B3DR93_ORYME
MTDASYKYSSVISECERRVTGRRGQNLTLPCNYDIKTNGPTEVCWGRGPVPTSGCSDQLLVTDGYNVIEETRVSSRYQLKGRLDEGDVSLTILNATEEDTGLYGCRVQISGPFNDEKHHVNLTVKRDNAHKPHPHPSTHTHKHKLTYIRASTSGVSN